MSIDLDQPLAWERANDLELAMLADLQGNILKSHGRNHAAHVFLRFDNPPQARQFVRALGHELTSAVQQLNDAKAFRENNTPAGQFLALLLSAAGYAALEVDPAKVPAGAAFRVGMKERGGELADAPPITWDAHLQHACHAMVLIADDSALNIRRDLQQLRQKIARHGGVNEIGVEFGKVIRNEYGRAIEHFGYVDGISVPVMLREDLKPTTHWSPVAPLGQALVRDPGGAADISFGSYMVFRKLEQDLPAFERAEHQLARMLGLVEEDEERAGAMLIGRFEDGTPVVLAKEDGLSPDQPVNDFNYADDPLGQRCPIHAHIRKVNPRGESVTQKSPFCEDERAERAHMIVRRGITYDAGLLFIAYQSSIEDQFEFMQRYMANNPGFVTSSAGLDPIIGQQASAPYQWPTHWGEAATPIAAPFGIGSFITLKGGEYFFAPSLSFLRSLP
jgi:Dyp-type peroxidase family